MLQKELAAVSITIVALMCILSYYMLRYQTWMDRLFFIQQIYFVNYYMVAIFPIFLYAVLLCLRYVMFQGITNLELTQALRSIKIQNLLKLIDFVEFSMTLPTIYRAVIIMVMMLHLILYVQLMEKRLIILYQEQDQLSDFQDNLKAKELHQKIIKLQYQSILKPVVICGVLIHWTLRYILNLKDKRVSIQSIKDGLTDKKDSGLYQKIFFFIILNLQCQYFKQLFGMVLNFFIIGKDRSKRASVTQKIQLFSAILYGLQAFIHCMNVANTLLLSIVGVNVLDLLDGTYEQKLVEIRKKYKPQKNIQQMPLLHRDFDFYDLLSDVYSLIRSCTEFGKELKKYTMTFNSAKLFNNLKTPTMNDLYGTDNVEEAKKAVQDNQCTICLMGLDLFNEKEVIKQLSCKHCYHQNCILQWVSQGNDQCPICKAKIFDGIQINEIVNALNPNANEDEERPNQNDQEIDLILGIGDQRENQNDDLNVQENIQKEDENSYSESTVSQNKVEESDNKVEKDQSNAQEINESSNNDEASPSSQDIIINDQEVKSQNIIAERQLPNSSVDLHNQQQSNQPSQKEESSLQNEEMLQIQQNQDVENKQHKLEQETQQKLIHNVQTDQQDEGKKLVKTRNTQKRRLNVHKKDSTLTQIISLPLYTGQSIENVQIDTLIEEFEQQFSQFINLVQAQIKLRNDPQLHFDLYKKRAFRHKIKKQPDIEDLADNAIMQHEVQQDP